MEYEIISITETTKNVKAGAVTVWTIKAESTVDDSKTTLKVFEQPQKKVGEYLSIT
jgi:hypothetical protein